MNITVLGCSGSLSAPGNPASGYLVQLAGADAVLLDMGPGVLAKLQEVCNPSEVHVALSHLHPDHCLDFPSLMVWRRFHPVLAAQSHNHCIGPQATFEHLGRLSADSPNEIDDMSDTFTFTPWVAYQPQTIPGLTITPYPVIHPIESYALRLVDHSIGEIIAYSGDSAYTEELVDCARDADVFLCEATWGVTSEGKTPNMHLSGAEAGIIATKAAVKRLVLVHIPPWVDPQGALDAARQHYDGPIDLAYSGMVID